MLTLPNRQRRLLAIENIVRIEDMESTCKVVLGNGGEVTVLNSIYRLHRALYFNDCFRVDAHLINLEHIRHIDETREGLLVTLTDGFSIAIPQHLEGQFTRRLGSPWTELLS